MVMTLNDAYLDLRSELKKHGIAGYRIEARELVCHALELDRDAFFQKKDTLIFDRDWAKICALRDRRLSGVPVQHITGRWEFYSLPFFVTPDTLIPRPDTEILVEAAIDFLKRRDKGRILDLCCGCGCVGIAVLKNVSEGITAVFADISEPALQVTRKNLVLNHVTPRSLTASADALLPPEDNLGRFHLITANPPYIPTGDLAVLDAEVRHEPALALDGGEDGLRFYRAIAKNYAPLLHRGGALMFEVGLGQWEEVAGILEGSGYRQIGVHKDLQGIERVVTGIVSDQSPMNGKPITI